MISAVTSFLMLAVRLTSFSAICNYVSVSFILLCFLFFVFMFDHVHYIAVVVSDILFAFFFLSFFFFFFFW